MLITTKQQLIKNLDQVEFYLSNGADELYKTMAKYISHGRVFVAYKVDKKYHFAPSRFIGYQNNTLVKHSKNDKKDGRETNQSISKILHTKNTSNAVLEDAYLTYCKWLDVTPTQNKRTYWELDGDIIGELSSTPFQEGSSKMRTHLVRERNRQAVQQAKEIFKSNHDGNIFCEICGFNFSKRYGKVGDGFIEAHHKVEFSKIIGIHDIKPSDFIMVCSNCHSMLHKGNLTAAQLKNRLK